MTCVHVKLISRLICRISHRQIIFFGMLIFIKVPNMMGWRIILLNIHIIGLNLEARHFYSAFLCSIHDLIGSKLKEDYTWSLIANFGITKAGESLFSEHNAESVERTRKQPGIISWKDKMLLLLSLRFSHPQCLQINQGSFIFFLSVVSEMFLIKTRTEDRRKLCNNDL